MAETLKKLPGQEEPRTVSGGGLEEFGPPERSQRWKNDQKLMQRVAGGDAAAQAQLLKRVLPKTRQIVRRIVGASEEADDVIQASLLALLNSAARFQGQCSVETWNNRIAARTSIRWMGKARALVPVEHLDPEAEPAVSPSGAQLPRDVMDYLSQLPPPQRTAVVLRYAVDYSVDEIAEETGSSRNTVKYRLKQGLATLRRFVRQDQLTANQSNAKVGGRDD